jgi:hypothetical protein
MKIQEIKKLCESSIHYDDDYFDIKVYRKALKAAILFAEDAAKHYNVSEGQRGISCLKAIENCFN